MKINILKSVLMIVSLFVVSCSSEKVIDESINQNDSVNVCFKFLGDNFDVSDNELSRGDNVNPLKLYYLRVYRPDVDYHSHEIGYVGLFSDLKYAQLKLKRGDTYNVSATALIEDDSVLDVNYLSKVFSVTHDSDFGSIPETKDTITILNQFSTHLSEYIGPGAGPITRYSGSINDPEYTDQSIDRFYGTKSIYVESEETIDINLKRFSYKLDIEIDAPSSGELELSCDKPNFKYRIKENSKHFSKKSFYSLGGFDLSTVSKTIVLKLKHFNNGGELTDTSLREIQVKPNVETRIYIHYDPIDANNQFNLILDQTPMGTEEVTW